MEAQEEGATTEVGTELLYPLPETRPPGEGSLLFSVDQLLTKLWPEKDFRQYLDKITNASAVTGKWEVDRGFAAARIQQEAKDTGMMDVVNVKLSKIMRAVETCLRRDGLGRRQRLAALNPPAAPAE